MTTLPGCGKKAWLPRSRNTSLSSTIRTHIIGWPLHGAAKGSGIEVWPMQEMAHILGVSSCKPAFADIGET